MSGNKSSAAAAPPKAKQGSEAKQIQTTATDLRKFVDQTKFKVNDTKFVEFVKALTQSGVREKIQNIETRTYKTKVDQASALVKMAENAGHGFATAAKQQPTKTPTKQSPTQPTAAPTVHTNLRRVRPETLARLVCKEAPDQQIPQLDKVDCEPGAVGICVLTDTDLENMGFGDPAIRAEFEAHPGPLAAIVHAKPQHTVLEGRPDLHEALRAKRLTALLVDPADPTKYKPADSWLINLAKNPIEVKESLKILNLSQDELTDITFMINKRVSPDLYARLSEEPKVQAQILLEAIATDLVAECSLKVHRAFAHKKSKLADEDPGLFQAFVRIPASKALALTRLSGASNVIIQFAGPIAEHPAKSAELRLPAHTTIAQSLLYKDKLGEMLVGIVPLNKAWTALAARVNADKYAQAYAVVYEDLGYNIETSANYSRQFSLVGIPASADMKKLPELLYKHLGWPVVVTLDKDQKGSRSVEVRAPDAPKDLQFSMPTLSGKQYEITIIEKSKTQAESSSASWSKFTPQPSEKIPWSQAVVNMKKIKDASEVAGMKKLLQAEASHSGSSSEQPTVPTAPTAPTAPTGSKFPSAPWKRPVSATTTGSVASTEPPSSAAALESANDRVKLAELESKLQALTKSTTDKFNIIDVNITGMKDGITTMQAEQQDAKVKLDTLSGMAGLLAKMAGKMGCLEEETPQPAQPPLALAQNHQVTTTALQTAVPEEHPAELPRKATKKGLASTPADRHTAGDASMEAADEADKDL